MKRQLEELLLGALARTADEAIADAAQQEAPLIERTRDAQHGDFATNIALRLAKATRRKPRELAQQIVAALPASSLVARTEIAGAGFINFFLTKQAYAQEVARIHAEGAGYGRSSRGKGARGERFVVLLGG